MIKKFNIDKKDEESLETKIDRLNSKISELGNISLFSASDSEAGKETPRKTMDEFDRYLSTEENEPSADNFNQIRMKLEDFRSHELRDFFEFDLESQIRSSFTETRRSEVELKEIGINELYSLYTQVKDIIRKTEIGDSSQKSVKFGDTVFSFKIIGIRLPDKKKLEKLFEKHGKTENFGLPDPRNSFFSPEVSQKFEEIEKKMKEEYKEACFNYVFSDFPEVKQVFDYHSRSLLERNYYKLKLHYDKCQSVSQELKWQNIEAQISNNLLVSKYQQLLKKEGELNFRQNEVNLLQLNYQENKLDLEARQKDLKNSQIQLEKEKRKLENMKEFIQIQIEEIEKHSQAGIDERKTSRIAESSPTLRRIRSKSRNSESIDSEIEKTQSEISKIEVSIVSSDSSQDSVELSKLYTRLTNLRTQKALDRNIVTTDALHAAFHGSPPTAKAFSREPSPGGRGELKPPTYGKRSGSNLRKK